MLDTRGESILSIHPSINTDELIYEHAIKTVKKCTEWDICGKFTDYFEINVHHISTRNRNFLLKVAKVWLKIDSCVFIFKVFKLFNYFPIKIR